MIQTINKHDSEPHLKRLQILQELVSTHTWEAQRIKGVAGCAGGQELRVTLCAQSGTTSQRLTPPALSPSSAQSVSLARSTRRPSLQLARGTSPMLSIRPMPRGPRATTPDDDIPTFDRNKVSLDFPGNLFGPSVSLLIRTTKIIGDVIQNSAVRYQSFLRLFRPLFRGQFEIKGLDPITTTTTTTTSTTPAPATTTTEPPTGDNEVRRRRRNLLH